jgi:hypothetical protein
MALTENIVIPAALRKRFPCVFLDEMQDTQKFQDELLCEIFPLSNPEINVQRFGDPDQAIFHGIGSEEPNDSFNGKLPEDMDFIVHKSHRFDAQLSNKIKSLSHNEVPLETELSDNAIADRLSIHSRGENFQHSVIVFNDDSRKNVIKKFAGIVSDQFDREYKETNEFMVKVVGAVGNEIDPNAEQLKIGHYWEDYDKKNSKSNYKETSLIDAVRYCRQSSSIDWAGSYGLLLKCILKLLRVANIKDEDNKYFSATSLKLFLKEQNEWDNFREAIYLMLNDKHHINQVFWNNICNALGTIFKFENIPANAIQFMSFVEGEIQDEAVVDEDWQHGNVLITLGENRIMHPDGFSIELSTIHGVKGETHDATLILETKNYNYDLLAMLLHFTGECPSGDVKNKDLKDKPTNVRNPLKMANKQFLRQLYVAASRPRHLLCFAIHEDRISLPQRNSLTNLGWCFSDSGNGDTDG